MPITNPVTDADVPNRGPRVTPVEVEAEITSEHYFTAAQGVDMADPEMTDAAMPGALDLLTFCVFVLRNGFTVTGESACAAPENFDAEIGRRIAREKAVEKVWPLLGFRLRDRLREEEIERQADQLTWPYRPCAAGRRIPVGSPEDTMTRPDDTKPLSPDADLLAKTAEAHTRHAVSRALYGRGDDAQHCMDAAISTIKAIAALAVQAPAADCASRYEDWWRLQTMKGDPSRRPNLVRDAYGSGYDQGRLDERTATPPQPAEEAVETKGRPSVPDSIIQLVSCYGDARADGLQTGDALGALIIALRDWAAIASSCPADQAPASTAPVAMPDSGLLDRVKEALNAAYWHGCGRHSVREGRAQEIANARRDELLDALNKNSSQWQAKVDALTQKRDELKNANDQLFSMGKNMYAELAGLRSQVDRVTRERAQTNFAPTPPAPVEIPLPASKRWVFPENWTARERQALIDYDAQWQSQVDALTLELNKAHDNLRAMHDIRNTLEARFSNLLKERNEANAELAAPRPAPTGAQPLTKDVEEQAWQRHGRKAGWIGPDGSLAKGVDVGKAQVAYFNFKAGMQAAASAYAEQPARKPLTDAKIYEIQKSCVKKFELWSHLEFARAIERSLGITGTPAADGEDSGNV